MKTFLYMAVSLDGFIALENDDAPWSDKETEDFAHFVKEKKNLVIGRRTYELMKEGGELRVFEEELIIVVSSRDDLELENDHTIVVSSPEAALAELEKRGFKEAAICGGGELNASFLERGLIDEMYVNVEPFVFGRGKKLFGDGEIRGPISLRYLDSRDVGGNFVQLHYEVRD